MNALDNQNSVIKHGKIKKTTPEDVHKAFKKVMKRAKFPKQTPFFSTEAMTPELRAAINDPEKFKQYLKEQESQRTTIRTAGDTT